MAGSQLESAFTGFLDEWKRSTWSEGSLPEGVDPVGYYSAEVGVAVEVALVSHSGRTTLETLRRAWKLRHANRKIGLVLLAASPDSDDIRVVGVHDGSRSGTVQRSTAERIVEEALEQTSTRAAEEVLDRLFVDPDDELPLGLRNGGLFASHSLVTTAPSNPRFSAPVSARGRRDLDLLAGLGWQVVSHGEHRLLRDGDQTRAVAVVLEGSEVFERPSLTYGLGTSPVEHALQSARARELPWVIAVQGSVVRLYSADADRGVARNGGAPYVELDVSLLEDEVLGYASLLLTPAALRPEGDVEGLLEDSRDHAVELGARLRDRVYTDAVPGLAETIARRFGDMSESGLEKAYHATLVTLFRLLFVAYAEDRGLLPYRSNAVYTRRSVKGRARELAERGDRAFDPAATDMWHDLIDIWSAIAHGNSDWGVPPYGGSLFRGDSEAGAAIAALELTNAEIGPVLAAMLVDDAPGGDRGPVDFRSLSVREFGTIYEGLLESSLSVALTDLTIRDTTKVKNLYLPAQPGDVVQVAAGGVYFHNASGARKATGSYFTKEFAVEHLLTTALDPTVAEHLERISALLAHGRESEAAEAFFDFRVADVAMGSGHFLVAAVDHLARDLEQFYLAHPIPGVKAELDTLRSSANEHLRSVGVEVDGAAGPQIRTSDLIRRQVAKRCLYGVDVNEIAVDLARLAIWIHTFVPGLPMSDLSHGLIHGNSLTGIASLDEVLEILEPTRADASSKWRADSLFRQPLVDGLRAAEEPLARAARLAEATVGESEQALQFLAEAEALLEPVRAVMDAALARRLGRIFLLEATVQGWDAVVERGRATAVREAVDPLSPVHFPVAFPEVFGRERGGFDVILGNPPWEKVKVEEHGWWGLRFPGLRSLSQRDKNTALERHRRERPDLVAEYEAEIQSVEALRTVLKSGPYPAGSGDTDLYKVFCWRDWDLLRPGGRAGIVFPRGALSGSGTAAWREEILSNGTFDDVAFLTNTGMWAFEMEPRYSIALTTLRRGDAGPVRFSGPFHSLKEFRLGARGGIEVPLEEFVSWSAGAVFPLLPGAETGGIFRKLRSAPRFDAVRGEGFRPVRELDATNDSRHFDVDIDRDREGRTAVLAGAGFELWNPDLGVPYATANTAALRRHLLTKLQRQTRTSSSAFYGLPPVEETLPINRARIAFRDVARATDTRTVVAALLPPDVSFTHKAPYLLRRSGSVRDEAFTLGVMASIPFDWFARRYVEITLSFELLNAFPVPRPATDDPLRLRAVKIAGRLAAVDERFDDWAAEVGVPVGSVKDKRAKDDLIAELDAVVSLLYGLSHSDVEHIFETFHRGWDYAPRLTAVLRHYHAWAATVGPPAEEITA